MRRTPCGGIFDKSPQPLLLLCPFSTRISTFVWTCTPFRYHSAFRVQCIRTYPYTHACLVCVCVCVRVCLYESRSVCPSVQVHLKSLNCLSCVFFSLCCAYSSFTCLTRIPVKLLLRYQLYKSILRNLHMDGTGAGSICIVGAVGDCNPTL